MSAAQKETNIFKSSIQYSENILKGEQNPFSLSLALYQAKQSESLKVVHGWVGDVVSSQGAGERTASFYSCLEGGGN